MKMAVAQSATGYLFGSGARAEKRKQFQVESTFCEPIPDH